MGHSRQSEQPMQKVCGGRGPGLFRNSQDAGVAEERERGAGLGNEVSRWAAQGGGGWGDHIRLLGELWFSLWMKWEAEE